MPETSETVSLDQGPYDAVDKLYDILLKVTRLILFPPDSAMPLHDLSVSQVRCLNAVGGDEGRKMQEIAARLHIKLPAMSQMVDRLVRKGLLERRPDPSDRRVARLHLTPKAKEMVEQVRYLRLNQLRQITTSLHPEQLRRMTEDLLLLKTIGDQVQQETVIQDREIDNRGRSVGMVEGHDPLVEMLSQPARNSRS